MVAVDEHLLYACHLEYRTACEWGGRRHHKGVESRLVVHLDYISHNVVPVNVT
jgi:hypothetical protein